MGPFFQNFNKIVFVRGSVTVGGGIFMRLVGISIVYEAQTFIFNTVGSRGSNVCAILKPTKCVHVIQ